MSIKYIVGVDEVGRGPLAGPVAVCACAVKPELIRKLRGIKDSKKLTLEQREVWFKKIKEWEKKGLLIFKVVFKSPKVIDRRGIVFAISQALEEALSFLNLEPRVSKVLLDGGLRAPEEYRFQKTIIKGDEKEPAIALASIAAKVMRDRLMVRMAKKYPVYGFEKHKGYGTKFHLNTIKIEGFSDIHRESFLKHLQIT